MAKTLILLALIAVLLLPACTLPLPDIKIPPVQVPDIKPPGIPAIPSMPPAPSLPSPSIAPAKAFPFLKPGEAGSFLKQPLFAITWAQDPTIFKAIPSTVIDWRVEHRNGGEITTQTKAEIARYLSQGTRVIGSYLSGMFIDGDNPPAAWKEFACLDLDLKPIPVNKPGMAGYGAGAWWGNLADPGWQKILLDQGRQMVDLGVEGFSIDEATFNREVVFQKGGTFDKYSIDGFRTWLGGRYTPAELAARFKINDLAAFNYRDYILRNNLRETWNREDNPPLLLTYEFSQFQMMECSKFWRRFSAELKAYAKEKYGREVLVSISASPEFYTVLFNDFADYLTGEHFYFNGQSPQVRAASVIRLGEPFAPRTAVLAEVSHDRGTLPNATRNLFKYIFADTYAAGGMLIADGSRFMTMRGWDYVQPFVTFDIPEAARYVNYAAAHPELYGLPRPARVALVESVPSFRGNGVIPTEGDRPNSGELNGMSELLTDLNLPFNVLLSGDGELVDRSLTLEALKPFKVVILPAVALITDAEVQALLDYAKGGGVVITTGRFGSYDRRGRAVARPALDALQGEGEHVLGSGKWVTVWDSPGADYYWNSASNQSWSPSARAATEPIKVKFLATLSKYTRPEVVTDAPSLVNLHRYADGKRVVLHMVNYDFDQARDAFRVGGPFKVTVELPAGMAPRKAVLHDFEKGAAAEIPFELQDGRAVFTLPGLYAYAVVEIS
jgi:hypothetical protein